MSDNTISCIAITHMVRDTDCLSPISLKYQSSPVPAPRVGVITDKRNRKKERREWIGGGQNNNGNRQHLLGTENVLGTVLSALHDHCFSQLPKEGTIISYILWLRKLRLRGFIICSGIAGRHRARVTQSDWSLPTLVILSLLESRSTGRKERYTRRTSRKSTE